MKNTAVLIFFSLICLPVAAQNFRIDARVSGLAEHSLIYLRLAKPEKILDSAKIIDGKFTFSARLDESPSKLIVFTEGYKNYIVFWAENTRMTLELVSGSFRKGMVKGSKTEDEYRLYSKGLEAFERKRDSLSHLMESSSAEAKKDIGKRLAENRERELEAEALYVQQHPNSLVAVYLLSVYTSTWGKEKSAALFNGLSDAMKKTSYGNEIHDFLTLNKPSGIGDLAVDFEQRSSDGTVLKFSTVRRQYTLVDFWASWCGPCRSDNPELVKTYDQFHARGFEIIGVSLDDNEKRWQKALSEDHLKWPNVSDLKGDRNQVALIYGVSGIPSNFLIDQNGVIVAKDLRGDVLRRKLTELLGK